MRSKDGKISFPNGDTYEGGFKQDRFMGEVSVLNGKSRHLEHFMPFHSRIWLPGTRSAADSKKFLV
jgi:hypothetical protein